MYEMKLKKLNKTKIYSKLIQPFDIQLISKNDLVTFTLRHKLKKRNSAFISVLHFTVAIGSSMIRINHTLINVREYRGTINNENSRDN